MNLNLLIVFYTQLGTMLKAGMDLKRSLSIMESQTTNPRWKSMFHYLSKDVEKGNSLSSGMKKYPSIFSSIQISIITAAERGGTLELALKNIMDYLENIQRIRRKLAGGLVYPVIIFHIAVFLPSISILIQKGVAAYLRTTLGFLIPVYLIVFLIYFAGKTFWYNPVFRNKFDAVLLSLPVLGGIAKKLSIANFTRSLSYLTGAGVSVVESLRLSADASGNFIVKNAILNSISIVEKGGRISAMLRKTKLFPEMVLGMVTVGEESGDIDKMLAKLTEYYEAQANQAIGYLVKILPVIVYLAVACYVGYVIISFWTGYYSQIFSILE